MSETECRLQMIRASWDEQMLCLTNVQNNIMLLLNTVNRVTLVLKYVHEQLNVL